MCEIKITDEIDLHYFNPKDIKEIISIFIEENIKMGNSSAVIITGKGKSVLKHRTIKIIEKHPGVSSWNDSGSNWGRVTIQLKSKD